ncbi:hypothetical protein RhiirA4_483564 [Rhizophagus irregularis]|uniref:FAR1 domain-containing protein n=1 Tax=Rhizophagus irregularis TaxID=588596 RepID=A0A2I1HMR4_9GLOM|nr:hypothetical protein RhiirA4_483564 [Rhizophagus irregularis]
MASSRYDDEFTLNEDENKKTNESLEDFDMTILPMGPVLGSELENFNVSEYPLLIQPVELVVGSRFSSWNIAEHYIKEHGRQKGFVINQYRVEYSKTQSSNTTDRTVRKRTFTCEYAGKYKPKKLKPIDQQRNKGSKKTDCKWHINLSKPESNNFVEI